MNGQHEQLARSLTALGAALLIWLCAWPASASADTTLTAAFSPSTRLGEGGSLSLGAFFSGSEYHGRVAPLTGLTFRLPEGIGFHDASFPTCTAETLRQFGPIKCVGAFAGALGSMRAIVPLGTEAVEEQGEVFPYFGPGGTMLFYLSGHTPISLEYVVEGHFVSDNASPPYGQDLELSVPIDEPFPNGNAVSITDLELNLGTVAEIAGHETWSMTLPTVCTGSTMWAAEAGFNNEPSQPFGETFNAACPPPGMRTPTTTTVTASNLTPAEGAPVTYTATVTPSSGPAPTGTVEFMAGEGSCPAQPLVASGSSSTATCEGRYADLERNEVRAYYSGSETVAPSLSHAITVTVHEGHEEEPPAEKPPVSKEEPPTPHEESHGSGGGGTTTPTTTASTSSPSASVSRTAVLASLSAVLTLVVPSGKAATIPALLKHGA